MTIDRDAVEQSCLRLCNAFAYHLDHGEFEALAALFSVDGVFDRNGKRLDGRKAILAEYGRRPAATTVHLMSNLHLRDIKETQIDASVSALVIHAMGMSDEVLQFDPAGAIRVLEFDDRYVLTDEGWRFGQRMIRPVLESPTWPGV